MQINELILYRLNRMVFISSNILTCFFILDTAMADRHNWSRFFPEDSSNFSLRADPRFTPNQWETVLLCNDASHWLGANLKWALNLFRQYNDSCWPIKTKGIDSLCQNLGVRHNAYGIFRYIYWNRTLYFTSVYKLLFFRLQSDNLPLFGVMAPNKWEAIAWNDDDPARWPIPLQWRHKEHGGVSKHRRFECLLNRLFRRR